MAKKTRTELSTLAINTNLPDNTQELITPTTERAQLTDERESVDNYKDDLGGTGNAGKFLTVAVDGESLTMVDAPTGDVTGTGTQYQLAVWDGTSALTGYAALTYINSILQAPQLRADSSNGTVTINATDASGGTAWLYFQNASVLKAEISYFIQDDFLTIRTYQKDIVFERSVNTPTLTIDGTTGAATFEGNVGINGSTTANVPLTATTNSGYEDVAYFKSAGTNIKARINLIPTGTGDGVVNATANNLVLQTGGADRLTISSGGDATFQSDANKVTINSTNSTQATLELGRSVDTKAKITSGDVSANDLNLYTLGNRKLSIGSNWTSNLDAYEEGTSTIYFRATGQNPTPTATANYTRVGNFVYYSFEVTLNALSASNAYFDGLPYLPASFFAKSAFYVGFNTSTNSNGGNIPTSGTYAGTGFFYQRDSLSQAVWNTGTTYLTVSGSYQV